MTRIFKGTIFKTQTARSQLVRIAAVLLVLSLSAFAADITAPVPAQILAAKKAFISNGGQDSTADDYSGGQQRCFGLRFTMRQRDEHRLIFHDLRRRPEQRVGHFAPQAIFIEIRRRGWIAHKTGGCGLQLGQRDLIAGRFAALPRPFGSRS